MLHNCENFEIYIVLKHREYIKAQHIKQENNTLNWCLTGSEEMAYLTKRRLGGIGKHLRDVGPLLLHPENKVKLVTCLILTIWFLFQ